MLCRYEYYCIGDVEMITAIPLVQNPSQEATHFKFPFGFLLCKIMDTAPILVDAFARNPTEKPVDDLEVEVWLSKAIRPFYVENYELFDAVLNYGYAALFDTLIFRHSFATIMNYANKCCANSDYLCDNLLMYICSLAHCSMSFCARISPESLLLGAKYGLVSFSGGVDVDGLLNNYQALNKQGKDLLYRAHSVSRLENIVAASLYELIARNNVIKKCVNCGGHFIPQKRNDAIYCDNTSPQDETRTCKEYGSQKLWYDKLKKDEALKLARNIYMSKQMLAKRNPDIAEYQESFEKYKAQSKQWKADVKAKKRTEAEYIRWLKDVKEKKVL